jgi:hypothetical protein
MANPKINSDSRTITVRVPISIRKRGGRKVVLTPDCTIGDPLKLLCQQADSSMVKAVARAFRWRDLLESGVHATIKEIAAAEAINESYIGRVLRLTLLAPDIIEAILQKSQSDEITLTVLMRSYSLVWREQRSRF